MARGFESLTLRQILIGRAMIQFKEIECCKCNKTIGYTYTWSYVDDAVFCEECVEKELIKEAD